MKTSANALSRAALQEFDPRGGGDGLESRYLCPLCGQEKPKDAAHRCLSVQRDSGAWHCHRCASGGVLQEFRQSSNTLTGTFPQQRAQAVEQRARLSRLAPSATPVIEHSPSPIEPFQRVWEEANPIADTPAAAYLASRGISGSVAALSLSRYSPHWVAGNAEAVLFALFDRAQNLVAVQGRYLAAQYQPKARTLGTLKSGVFSAFCEVNGRRFEPLDAATPTIIVTEAPIDALSLAMAGFPALALCGTTLPTWFHLACGLKKVALATDADDAGDAAAAKHAAFLTIYGAQCQRLRPENAKDWNEMLLRQGSHDLSDWILARLDS